MFETHRIRGLPHRHRRSVRCTDAEWALIRAIAARREVHTSTALRDLALKAAREELAGEWTSASPVAQEEQ